MSMRMILAAGTLAVAATTASAERSVYLGFGADYGVPHSGEDQAFGSLIAGATFELWEYMGLGIEAEFGEPVGGNGDNRETSRLRGLFTYEFGPVTGIASLGKVQYELGDATVDGETVGLGVQMEIRDRIQGRFEFIRDFNGDDYDTNVTTSRLAILYTF